MVPIRIRPSTTDSHTSIRTLRIPPCELARRARRFLVLWQQAAQAQIVDHILNFLDAVLDAVAALPQRVVLEVEDLEAGVDVFDELCDLQGTAVVA